jgi:alpha-tubulin suppressor-like RCC1 family protein
LPVAAMAGVRVRSVAAGGFHSLALSLDGRVYSWGRNAEGQLGHGDMHNRHSPVRVDGLEGVHSIAAATRHSHAVTQSGEVFSWGGVFHSEVRIELRPVVGVGGSARTSGVRRA